MSYNSKKVRKAQLKAQFKRADGKGGKAGVTSTFNKGPAKTEKKTSKKLTWHAKLAGKVAPTAPVKQKRDEADE